MAKAFFEVFPGLKLESKLKSLFEQTCIERVTATKQKDFVRIYLTSDRLIQKEDIFTVEKEIKKRTKDVKDCEIQISTAAMDMSALGGSGINIQIKGKELEELQAIAKELAKQLEGVKGTQNISDGLEDADAQYEVLSLIHI